MLLYGGHKKIEGVVGIVFVSEAIIAKEVFQMLGNVVFCVPEEC